VQLCPLPVSKLADIGRNKVAQITRAIGAALNMTGIAFEPLDSVLREQFKKKGEAVAAENLAVARLGYEHSGSEFQALSDGERVMPPAGPMRPTIRYSASSSLNARNSSLKSGVSAMLRLLDHYHHFPSCAEDGLVALPLPELSVEFSVGKPVPNNSSPPTLRSVIHLLSIDGH
jgi:hypothetical protein